MIREEDTVKVGYFARPHGIKGELSLVTDYDLFEDTEDPFVICEMDGILVPFFVESYRYKSNSVILVKIENIDDELTAKQFINKEVFYPADRLETPSMEELGWKFYTGYILEGKEQGELGIINYVDETTINTLFNVDYRGKELLIPVADELVDSVDHNRRSIVLTLPEGILMVNDEFLEP